MKRLGLAILISIGLLGCSAPDDSKSEHRDEKPSSVVKNELEQIGLTYGQSIEFDEYVAAVSKNIEGLQDFNFKVINDFDALTPTSNTDILINTYLIETSYRNNGGKEQDNMVNFLQDGVTGFFQISENMYKYQREYTLLEAYSCLGALLSFTNEIGKSYELDETGLSTLQEYFLKNINTKGKFIEAADTLLSEL